MGKLPAKVYKKNKKADLNLKLPWPKITITINKIGKTMVISFILLIIMLKFLYFNASCLNFYKAAADGVSVLVLQKILPLFIPFWIIRIWFSPSIVRWAFLLIKKATLPCGRCLLLPLIGPFLLPLIGQKQGGRCLRQRQKQGRQRQKSWKSKNFCPWILCS